MARWGSGNFENDAALDYLGSLSDRLTETVDRCLGELEPPQLAEDGEGVLMPSVALLALLVEHCRAAPPPPVKVAEWCDVYLALFDEQTGGPGHLVGDLAERRRVIVDTFMRLTAMARAFWG